MKWTQTNRNSGMHRLEMKRNEEKKMAKMKWEKTEIHVDTILLPFSVDGEFHVSSLNMTEANLCEF